MGVLLTQAFSLGFVVSPLWGSHARASRLGKRLLRIPNPMVLDHPDEFVRKLVGTTGTATEKARK
jgi:hypothetical protein